MSDDFKKDADVVWPVSAPRTLKELQEKWRKQARDLKYPPGEGITLSMSAALESEGRCTYNQCATELMPFVEREAQGPGLREGITLHLDLKTAGEIGLFEFLKSKGFEHARLAAEAEAEAAASRPGREPQCGCEKDRCFGPISGYSCRAENEYKEAERDALADHDAKLRGLVERKREGWMDSVDFDCELGSAVGGNEIYCDEEDLREHKPCIVPEGTDGHYCYPKRVYVFDADEFDAALAAALGRQG